MIPIILLCLLNITAALTTYLHLFSASLEIVKYSSQLKYVPYGTSCTLLTTFRWTSYLRNFTVTFPSWSSSRPGLDEPHSSEALPSPLLSLLSPSPPPAIPRSSSKESWLCGALSCFIGAFSDYRDLHHQRKSSRRIATLNKETQFKAFWWTAYFIQFPWICWPPSPNHRNHAYSPSSLFTPSYCASFQPTASISSKAHGLS